MDTQETIVSALMKSSYLFSICREEMSDGYFSSPSCKVIYKSLLTYYSKYKGMPRLNELLISIDECYYPTCGVNLSEVKDTCCRLWELPEPDELFIKDKVTDFVRKVRSSTALKNFVDQLKVNPSLESDSIVSDLVKALEVQFSNTRTFSMTDAKQVDAVRNASVGSNDQSKIVHSFLESLNQVLMFGGFQPSTVNMILSPPGCFTGDTKVLTPEGARTIESLYESQSKVDIYGSCNEDIEKGSYSEVYLSSYEDRLIEVTFECSAFDDTPTGQSTIRCTLDHPFLTVSGEYKKAESLKIGDKIEGITVIRICDSTMREVVQVVDVKTVTLEEKIPVYGLVDAKPFGNYAIALNNREGVFVSNTGKSMYLINEGVCAAKQGFEVLHIFIGDMVEYDGFIRYLSRVSGTPQNSLVMMPSEKQMSIVKVCNQQYDNILDRITMISYPSLSITVDTLTEDISKFEKQLEKDFDVIIVDYPDNLILEGRSLYEDGGTLYSSLEKLARLSKSVVLVASQPQKSYWGHQIIPLEAAAESSKKQQAVDIMLTMNTESRGANFGTMLLAKARKGEVGKIFRFRTDYAKCLIEEVDEGTFQALKSSYGQIH